MAAAGGAAQSAWMIKWYENGADTSSYPKCQEDKEQWVPFMVFHKDGSIDKYEQSPYPIKFPPQLFASGSGRDFALMAMRLGKSPKEAVELTMEFDSGCGNGVDVLGWEDDE